jgi:hypothetical protein
MPAYLEVHNNMANIIFPTRKSKFNNQKLLNDCIRIEMKYNKDYCT